MALHPASPTLPRHALAEFTGSALLVAAVVGSGIAGRRHIDWDLPDPKGMPPDEVRRVRDEIRRRVSELARELARP